MATIDADGFMQITDRKDVIKSGGEWISSIDIGEHRHGAPSIQMAAGVGMPHQVGRAPHRGGGQAPGTEVTARNCLHFYEGKTAKWQIPMTWCLWMPSRSVPPARC